MKFRLRQFQSNCWFLILALFFSLVFPACQKDDDENGRIDDPVQEDPLKPKPEISTTIAGVVTDESGTPLPGVTVSVNGETGITSPEGYFIFREVSVPANRCVVSCAKEGFFTSIRGVVPVKDNTTQVRFVLMNNAITHSIDASTGGKATLNNGSEVDIPANGLISSSGDRYTGTVNMTVRYLDSSSPEFANIVPGGDMLARRTDERTSILYSYGILRVQLTGEDGEDLQIAPGKNSTLTVTIPESQLSTAPASIPLWYFDEEAGVWQEEGSAAKQGNKYIGTVTHFTDWNCDDPKDRATVIGKVVDCTGKPVITGEIYAGQSSSELGNGTSIDNSSGPGDRTGFQMTVPANTPLFVMVPKPFTIPKGGGDLVLVPVPPLRPGQVYDVGTIMPHPCPNSASGKFKTSDGDKVESVMFKVTDPGNNEGIAGSTRFLYHPQNTFTFSGFPPNATFSMVVVTTSGIGATKIFQTGNEGENTDLGEIDLTPGGGLVTIHGIVSCGNTPLENATVKLEWAGGSATATTNSVGVYGLSAPTNMNVTLTIEHLEGTLSESFQSPAEGIHNFGVSDLCSNSTVGENSFILNGDGLVNASRVFSVEGESGAAVAFYSENENTTTISILDQSDSLSMSFKFTGHGVREVTPDKVQLATVSRKVQGNWRMYAAGQDIGLGEVNLNITRYEGPGGLLEGTFSGTFHLEGSSPVEIVGKISVERAF